MKKVQDGDEDAFAELSEKVGGFTDEMLSSLEESGVLKDLGAEKMAANLKKSQEEALKKKSGRHGRSGCPRLMAQIDDRE